MAANLREMMECVREWLDSRPQTDLEKYLILKGAKSPADIEHWIREYTYKNGNSLT
jgi:hypothetical protein